MKGLLFLILACLSMPAMVIAAPLQVLLPSAPPTERISRLTDGQRWRLAAAVYFHERLAGQRGLLVADAGWGSAVLQRLTGPGRITPVSPLFPAVREHMPIDAMVQLDVATDSARVVVEDADGRHEVQGPVNAAGIRRMAEAVADALPLESSVKARLTARWVPDHVLLSCLLSQRYKSDWIYSAGEARLEMLVPHFEQADTYPYIAACALRAGVEHARSGGELKNADRFATRLRMALPKVLATPFESDARRFLKRNKLRRQLYADEILELAKALDVIGGALDASDIGEGDPGDMLDAGFEGEAVADEIPRKRRLGAVRVLGVAAGDRGMQTLRALARHTDADVRAAAADALRDVNTDEAAELLAEMDIERAEPTTTDDAGASVEAMLWSADVAVVRRALRRLPARWPSAIENRVFELAANPSGAVAEAARLALASRRPTQTPARWTFDLAYEHLYLKLKAVREMRDAGASAGLLKATRHTAPEIRAAALLALAETTPDALGEVLDERLLDPHRWVRMHAAALAATHPQAASRAVLENALATAADKPVEIMVQRALDHLDDIEPERLAPVHTFESDRARFGLCGVGSDAGASPYSYYYLLNFGNTNAMRRAHDKGAVVMARANETTKNPYWVLFHEGWRDAWWNNLANEFLPHLPHLDGMILGEESMYFRPNQLWGLGWRVFCMEAGIDPLTIDGDRDKLTDPQARAWRRWEEQRGIGGFNRMHDFVKLYFGAMRPGFLVGTFMVQQNGPTEADRNWRFDVAGAYYYQTSNRVRYNQIRRYKTLWPQRPVIYLVDGGVGTAAVVGFGGNALRYNTPMADTPFMNRRSKAYAHSVAVWLAGGNPGYFATWLAVAHNARKPYSGTWLMSENIGRDAAAQRDAIDGMMRGVQAMYRNQAAVARERNKSFDEQLSDEDDILEDFPLEEPDPQSDPAALKAKADRLRLRTGFQLEQYFEYLIAAAVGGLPYPGHRHEILFVGQQRHVGEHEAASDYDYLRRITRLGEIPLKSYRLIGLIGCDKDLLTDATIASVDRWLRKTPGILYIRGWVRTDDQAEWSSVADMDGRLSERWPWKSDVQRVEGGYATTGSATPLGGTAAKTERVLWRHPDYKGVVLFTQKGLGRQRLRDTTETLRDKYGVGPEWRDHPGYLSGTVDALHGRTTASKAGEAVVIEGTELLTGERGPSVGPGRQAALTADAYEGAFKVVHEGVVVLGVAPLERVSKSPGRLQLRSTRFIRVSGEATVSVPQAEALEQPETPEAAGEWLASGRPGIAVLQRDGRPTVTLVRADETVDIRIDKR